MPMHDWTRVSAGTYHAFHNAWITHLQEALNAGRLPPEYYALGEQRADDISPDLLTLHAEDEGGDEIGGGTGGTAGMVAVAESPPAVRIHLEAEADLAFYLARQRSLVIRHSTGDRIVAILEIVSPANKHTRKSMEDFVDKVCAALKEGIHVAVIDPLPPSRHDPLGIHGAIWEQLMAGPYSPSDGLPLTLVSYCAKHRITADVEPIHVGSTLIDLPIFLTRTHYVPLPLEMTYMQAWTGVPRRWKRVIEGA
jgi:hypothetical protein